MAVGTQYLAEQPKLRTSSMVLGVIAIAALLAAPFFFYPVMLMSVLCFALFACAFNLLIGYVGLLSFGHAAFFGGAAYVTAHAAKVWGWEPLSAILLGVAGAAVMGLVIGFVAIRRQGIYFAMITLALSQMFAFICLQVPFTHGEDGIQGVPRGYLLGLAEGLTKVFYPEASNIVIFVIMAIVLLVRPAGLFGRDA